MIRPLSRTIMRMGLALVCSLLGGAFAFTATAETIRVGNIVLEYGQVGHNPLQ